MEHVVPAVLKPARTLWNEVIGFLFICLAVIFGSATVRSYLEFINLDSAKAPGKLLLQLVMGSFATFIVLYYGISSFVRARRISRS